MAVYDYKCPNCKYEQELEHKMSEDPAILCPHCNDYSSHTQITRMVKQISLSNFSLKGTGWYRDGYGSKK